MSFSSLSNSFSRLADDYNKNQTGKRPVKYANLVDLTEALGTVFSNLQTTESTIPPQAKYNATVSKAMGKLGVFSLVPLLNQICDFYTEDFGFCTTNVPLERFTAKSKEDFLEYRNFYVSNKVLNQTLDEIFPTEIIRAIRLYLQSLLFRFFKTYDVSETRSVTDKKTKRETRVEICNSSNAYYRIGEKQLTNSSFMNCIDLIIEANKFIREFSLELDEITTPFREAAITAKLERYNFYKTNVQQQALQKIVKPKGKNATEATEATDATDATDAKESETVVVIKHQPKPFAKRDPSVKVWTKPTIQITETTEASGATDATETTETTGATDASGATETTGATDTTDTTETNGATDATETTEADGFTVVPKKKQFSQSRRGRGGRGGERFRSA
jgi:hypothetical protein